MDGNGDDEDVTAGRNRDDVDWALEMAKEHVERIWYVAPEPLTPTGKR
jgi:hypothetical protein